ncbi:hypothetical protein BDV11DRAFT_161967 [Aspergillus similis]
MLHRHSSLSSSNFLLFFRAALDLLRASLALPVHPISNFKSACYLAILALFLFFSTPPVPTLALLRSAIVCRPICLDPNSPFRSSLDLDIRNTAVTNLCLAVYHQSQFLFVLVRLLPFSGYCKSVILPVCLDPDSFCEPPGLQARIVARQHGRSSPYLLYNKLRSLFAVRYLLIDCTLETEACGPSLLRIARRNFYLQCSLAEHPDLAAFPLQAIKAFPPDGLNLQQGDKLCTRGEKAFQLLGEADPVSLHVRGVHRLVPGPNCSNNIARLNLPACATLVSAPRDSASGGIFPIALPFDSFLLENNSL